MVAMDDERRWILRSQNGDHEAFESLIQSYQRNDSLAGISHDRLACRRARPRAGNLQFRLIGRLRVTGVRQKFSSWLYRIAVNRCLNWKKWNERQRELHEQLIAESGEKIQQAR